VKRHGVAAGRDRRSAERPAPAPHQRPADDEHGGNDPAAIVRSAARPSSIGSNACPRPDLDEPDRPRIERAATAAA